MKDKPNPLDDFFRESLQDLRVTPRDDGWKRFAKETRKAGLMKRWSIFRFTAWMIAGTLLVTSAVLMLPGNKLPQAGKPGTFQAEDQWTAGAGLTSNVTHPAADRIAIPEVAHRSLKTNTEKSVETPLRQPESEPVETHPKHYQQSIIPGPGNSASNSLSGNDNSNHAAEELTALKDGYDQQSQDTRVPDLIPTNREDKIADTTTVSSQDDVKTPGKQGKDPVPEKLPKTTWAAALSLHYRFDQSFQELKVNAHNLALEAAFSKGRISFSSGAGITFTERNQQVKVMFNEYLGTYDRLDSISFNWDPDRYHLIPTYYTTELTVYDSSVMMQHYFTRNRYTYIHIPVSAGYQIVNRGKFGAGIRTGMEMYFFIDSQHKSGTYTAGLNKIIYQIPEDNGMKRNDLFWFGGLGFDYYLNRKMTFSLEPAIRYRFTHHGNGNGSPDVWMPWLKASVKLKL